MKNLRLLNSHNLQYTDTPKPTLVEGEVLLKVKYCGICRTDAKMWDSGQRDLTLPRVLGHEFCGIDSDNKTFVVWPAKKCGICEHCLNNNENLCSRVEIIGFHRDGGMAEYVSVPKESLIPLPPNLPEELSIFAEPMACGINALNQFCFNNNKLDSNNSCELRKIIIFGGGTCGLLLALVAKQYGLEPTVIEIDKTKREKSLPFIKITGISINDSIENAFRINHNQGDINLKHITNKEWYDTNIPPTCGDQTFDYGINATSDLGSLEEGIKVIKPLGEFSIFSGLNNSEKIPTSVINEIHYRQLKLSGAYGCTKSGMVDAINIIDKNRDAITTLIEEFITLEEVEKELPKIIAGERFRYIINLTEKKA